MIFFKFSSFILNSLHFFQNLFIFCLKKLNPFYFYIQIYFSKKFPFSLIYMSYNACLWRKNMFLPTLTPQKRKEREREKKTFNWYNLPTFALKINQKQLYVAGSNRRISHVVSTSCFLMRFIYIWRNNNERKEAKIYLSFKCFT